MPKEKVTPSKVQTTNKYTPFWSAGAGGKKGEEKLESQDRVVLSQPQRPPLIYSEAVMSLMLMGGSDDTMLHL